MRKLILCLSASLMTSATLAGEGVALAPLHMRDLVGLLAFAVLGGMLIWHLRK
jgi:hypothetical protein